MPNLIANFRRSAKRKSIKRRRTEKRGKVKRKRTKTEARINTKKRKIERKSIKTRTGIKTRHQMKSDMKEEMMVAMVSSENTALRMKHSRILLNLCSWVGGLEMNQQGMETKWFRTSLLLIREGMRELGD